MYKDVSTSMDFASREHEILEFWRTTRALHESIRLRADAPIYTFYDGPPTANGAPHFGHVITRAVKDLFPRYKTMKGYKVLRKAGWDTHGLPVELEVEKALGISGKPQIEVYGIEPFIKKCKDSVLTYEAQWREMSERVGFWADMDEPYVTYHNNYIESVWWALGQMWLKNLIYKSYRVVPYCPRCGTPLSSHEVAQGYKEVTEDSAYAAFKLCDADEYILAWTTTPWTLPSNVGLCVNAKETYARVRHDGRVYILAEALVPTLFEGAEVLETFAGSTIVGTRYEPLFPSEYNNADGWRIVADDYVTLSDGTGVVHIAPAFGEDDARVSRAYGLPFMQLVDAQGNFLADVPIWGGKFVKDADPLIIQELRRRGQLFRKQKTTHNYPFCWRCATPLIYYARDAWFIKMSAMREELLAANDTVNWLPEHMRRGRFGQFLEGVLDWSISRERYWGTPLPIWLCEGEGCAERVCVGSVAELADKSGQNLSGLELHKPYIDAITIPCKSCGGIMRRTPEVIDCWFDSGSMPFAQWHYPFENKELFDANFPADFIAEGVDQTRGWFYSLIAISTVLFGRSPYKNVIVTGHGLDEHGQKMSKSIGNVTKYIDALNTHGADALRWFLYAGSQPWQNFKYSPTAVTDVSRRFLGTLWNTYAFYVLYAKIDGFNPYNNYDPDSWDEESSYGIMDRWLMSRLDGLIAKVTTLLDVYDVTESARAIDVFVDEMSNWYLRLERERFWASGMKQDKVDAYYTLHTCLVTLAQLIAPFVPFIAEQIYQNLVCNLYENDGVQPGSVHHCSYPEANQDLSYGHDAQLEAQMDTAIQITTLGRAARNLAQIKTRQPLSEALVALADERQGLGEDFLAIIRRELNVKDVRLMRDASQYVTYKFKPQLRTLGPRYGAKVPKITGAMNADPEATALALKSGSVNLTIDGEQVTLSPDDILVDTQHKPGYYAASDAGITVVLNTTITDALLEEGIVREVKAKYQSMRREAGFNVTDRIIAGFDDTPLAEVLSTYGGEIAHEILSQELQWMPVPEGAYSASLKIHDKEVSLWVRRI